MRGSNKYPTIIRSGLEAVTSGLLGVSKHLFPQSDWRCLGLCHQQQFRGAILSVSYPSVNVHYIGTRNIQLMHCNECAVKYNINCNIAGFGFGCYKYV